MIAFLHRPLEPVHYDDLKSQGTLELREMILNQRLLDSHYAQLRVENIEKFRRLKKANSGE